jgi:hypothetical protein
VEYRRTKISINKGPVSGNLEQRLREIWGGDKTLYVPGWQPALWRHRDGHRPPRGAGATRVGHHRGDAPRPLEAPEAVRGAGRVLPWLLAASPARRRSRCVQPSLDAGFYLCRNERSADDPATGAALTSRVPGGRYDDGRPPQTPRRFKRPPGCLYCGLALEPVRLLPRTGVEPPVGLPVAQRQAADRGLSGRRLLFRPR